MPENGDVPARVTLLDIPSRNEKKCKNIFSVADIKMNWHKNGDFLCVKVDRYAKVKREKEGNKYRLEEGQGKTIANGLIFRFGCS